MQGYQQVDCVGANTKEKTDLLNLLNGKKQSKYSPDETYGVLMHRY